MDNISISLVRSNAYNHYATRQDDPFRSRDSNIIIKALVDGIIPERINDEITVALPLKGESRLRPVDIIIDKIIDDNLSCLDMCRLLFKLIKDHGLDLDQSMYKMQYDLPAPSQLDFELLITGRNNSLIDELSVSKLAITLVFNPNIINLRDINGKTLLDHAAMSGFINGSKAIGLLLQILFNQPNIDFSCRDEQGDTCMHVLAKCCHDRMTNEFIMPRFVEGALKHGYNFSIQNNDKYTFLDYIAYNTYNGQGYSSGKRCTNQPLKTILKLLHDKEQLNLTKRTINMALIGNQTETLEELVRYPIKDADPSFNLTNHINGYKDFEKHPSRYALTVDIPRESLEENSDKLDYLIFKKLYALMVEQKKGLNEAIRIENPYDILIEVSVYDILSHINKTSYHNQFKSSTLNAYI